jgi:multiple sugar transport system permease protein
MENLLNPPKLSLAGLRRLGPVARREMRNGLLFISPWIIGFLAFTLLPILATLLFSFMDLKITDFGSTRFVGFANYVNVFKDTRVWNADQTSNLGSMWITIRFGLIALPVDYPPLGNCLVDE